MAIPTLRTYECSCPPGTKGNKQCRECSPGKFAQAANSSLCAECAVGRYSSQPRSTSCTECPPGSRCPFSSVDPVPCAPGYYQASSAQTVCESCAQGNFSAVYNSTMCQTCPSNHECSVRSQQPRLCSDGMFQPRRGQTKCLHCEAGYYRIAAPTNHTCVACPKGFSCASTRENPAVCEPGFFQPKNATTECEACAPGRFQELFGQTACKNCASGSFQTLFNASTCSPCIVGHACFDTLVQPVPCGAGEFQRDTGQSDCRLCQPGLYQDDEGSSVCNACPRGYYCPTVFGIPIPCSPGHFQRVQNQTTCEKCSAGMFQNATSGSLCSACAPGFSCLAAHVTPVPCPAGFFQDMPNATGCNACAPGLFQNDSAQPFCLGCPAGHMCVNAEGAPAACAVGKFQVSWNQTSCNWCTKGSYQDKVGQSDCRLCPRGSMCPSLFGPAVPCPTGQFQPNMSASECRECEQGWFQNDTGRSTCLECPVGSKCENMHLAPSACEPGTFQNRPSKTSCRSCAPGQYQTGHGQSDCEICPLGKRCASRDVLPINCSVGYFQSSSNSTACELCQSGQYQISDGQSECIPCPRGTSCEAAYEAPVSCSAGEFQPSIGTTSCFQCPTGSFQDLPRQLGCQTCPRGHRCPRNYAAPIPCAAGFFQDEFNTTVCKQCLSGMYTNVQAQSQCRTCNPQNRCPRRYANQIACDSGKYQDDNAQTACKRCPPGQYQDERNQSQCKECGTGHFCLHAASPPVRCKEGTFQGSQEATACATCPAGKYQNLRGQASCKSCPPGFSCGNEFGPPLECAIGKYRAKPNGSTCALCSPGQYQNMTGATRCQECPVHQMCPFTGMLAGIDCALGVYYQPLTNQTKCERCDVSTDANNPGLASDDFQCAPCEAGYFVDFEQTDEALLCQECPAGRFTNDRGQRACSACSRGMFQSGTERASCQPCRKGRFMPAEGNYTLRAIDGCVACPHGMSSEVGRSACTECMAGTFATRGNPFDAFGIEFTDVDRLALRMACSECGDGWNSAAASGITTFSTATAALNKLHDNFIAMLMNTSVHDSQETFLSFFGNATARVASAQSCSSCGVCPHETEFVLSADTNSNCPSASLCNIDSSDKCEAAAQFIGLSDSTAGVISRANKVAGCFLNENGALKFNSRLDNNNRESSDGESVVCKRSVCADLRQMFCDASNILEGTLDEVRMLALQGLSRGCTGNFNGSIASLGECPCLGNQVDGDCSAFAVIYELQGYEHGSGNGKVCPQDSNGECACFACAPGQRCPDSTGVLNENCAPGYFSHSMQTECDACSAGEFQSLAGQVSCDQCEAGKFAASTGTAICTNCSSGWYTTMKGSNKCFTCGRGFECPTSDNAPIPCPPGYFQDADNATACDACTIGRFQDLNQTTVCRVCDLGRFQILPNATRCAPCAEGFFANSTEASLCTECPLGSKCPNASASPIECGAGTFQDASGQTQCSPCEPGRFQEAVGQANCNDCVPGQFQAYNQSTGCQNCSVGWYTTTNASDTCFLCGKGSQCPTLDGRPIPCLQGFYQDTADATECKMCEIGRFQPFTNATTCTLCSPGQFQDIQTATVCLPCESGFFAENFEASVCTVCPIGSRCSNATVPHELCPAGFVQNQSGQTACNPCRSGRFQNNAGQPDCAACVPGRFQNQTQSTSCRNCSAGWFTVDHGSPTCSRCGPGNACPRQDRAPVPCAPGYFQDSMESVDCKPCPIGRFQNGSGATACVACSSGRFQSDKNSTQCQVCAEGFFANMTESANCTVCPAGSQCPNAVSSPIPCEPGTVQPHVGQTRCGQCAAGQFQNSPGQKFCLNCDAGTFQPANSSTTCLECLRGWFAPSNGSSSCFLCGAGNKCPTLFEAPVPCAPGFFQDEHNATDCDPCRMGRFQPLLQSTSCTNCAPGQFQNISRATACAFCVSGFFANDTESTSCNICPVGHKCANASDSPTACTKGFVQDAPGRTECSSCGAGFFQTSAASTTCEACAPGRFQPEIASTKCQNCSAGWYSIDAGAPLCYACAVGFACPTLNGPPVACKPGFYQDQNRSTICSSCEIGRFQHMAGTTACNVCSLGTFQSHVAQTTCLVCPDGTFANVTGSSNCSVCPAGSSCPDAESSYQPCDRGFVQYFPGKTACDGCRRGFYQAERGQRNCTSCNPGFFQSNTASTACAACLPGWFTTEFGASRCGLCGAGNSCANAKDAPNSCEPGFFQNLDNATTCAPCLAGQFQNQTGATSCALCPSGRFQFALNATACGACPPGYFATAEESTNCSICPTGAKCPDPRAVPEPCFPGTVQPNVGKTSCLDCAQGMFQSDTGKPTCRDCFAGRFQAVGGSTQCIDCENGWFATLNGSHVCEPCGRGYSCLRPFEPPGPCARGFFQSEKSATMCAICAVGRYQNETASTHCDVCRPGRFQPSVGSTSCIECATGWYTTFNESSACAPCGVGNACPSSSGAPIPCAPGFFQSMPNATACSACAVGKFEASYGASACQVCDVGKYQQFTNTTSCFGCSDGSFANSRGSSQCTTCPVGYRCPNSTQSPKLCRPGHAQNATGQTACNECGAGKYMDEAGGLLCKRCHPGQFQSLHQQTSCALCAVGMWTVASGSTECAYCGAGYSCTALDQEPMPCGPGFFQARSNATMCDPCQPGRFQSNFTSTACAACAAGQFQDGNGTSICRQCARGKFQFASETTACIECDTGQFSAFEGASTCEKCAVGQYQGQMSQASCNQCARGQFSEERGQTACIKCAEGRFQPSEGRSDCPSCVTGQYQVFQAQTKCLSCVANSKNIRVNDELVFDKVCECERDYFLFVDPPSQERIESFLVASLQAELIVSLQEDGVVAQQTTPSLPTSSVPANASGVTSSVHRQDWAALVADRLLSAAEIQLLYTEAVATTGGENYHCVPCITGADCAEEGTEFIMQPVINPDTASLPGIQPVITEAVAVTSNQTGSRRSLQRASAGVEDELHDGTESFSWLKSSEGYWQNPEFFFDRHGLSLRQLVSNDDNISVASDDASVAVDGFKFENCFSIACAHGEWDGCVGNNSGIMCRQCLDTDVTACTDQPGIACNTSTLFGVTFNTTFTKSNGSLCEPCDTIAGANTTLIAVATVVGVLLLVGLVVAFFLRRLWWKKVKTRLRTARGSKHIRDARGSIASKFLMLLNFFQIQSMFMNPETFESEPEELSLDLSWMDWANLDIERSLACLYRGEFGVTFSLFAAMPLLLGLVFLILYYGSKLCCYRRSKDSFEVPAAWHYVSSHLIRFTIVILYVLYAQVSRIVLQAFHCKSFDAEGAFYGENIEVRRLYAADFRIMCDFPDDGGLGTAGQGRYRVIFILGIVFSVLYPAGIPVALVGLLFKNRHRLDDTCDPRCAVCNNDRLNTSEFEPVFHQKHMRHETVSDEAEFVKLGYHMPRKAFDTFTFIRFSSLVASYKPSFWYFEIVIMMHKLFLCVVVVFLNPGSPEQLVIAIVEIVVVTGVVVIASPHNSRAETVMYSVIQLALFSTLLKLLMQKADFDGDIYDWGAITGVIVYGPVVGTVLVVLYPVIEFAANKIKRCLKEKRRIKREEMLRLGKDPDALLTAAQKKKIKRRKLKEIQRRRDQQRKKRRSSVAKAGKFYDEDGVELVALSATDVKGQLRLARKNQSPKAASTFDDESNVGTIAKSVDDERDSVDERTRRRNEVAHRYLNDLMNANISLSPQTSRRASTVEVSPSRAHSQELEAPAHLGKGGQNQKLSPRVIRLLKMKNANADLRSQPASGDTTGNDTPPNDSKAKHGGRGPKLSRHAGKARTVAEAMRYLTANEESNRVDDTAGDLSDTERQRDSAHLNGASLTNDPQLPRRRKISIQDLRVGALDGETRRLLGIDSLDDGNALTVNADHGDEFDTHEATRPSPPRASHQILELYGLNKQKDEVDKQEEEQMTHEITATLPVEEESAAASRIDQDILHLFGLGHEGQGTASSLSPTQLQCKSDGQNSIERLEKVVAPRSQHARPVSRKIDERTLSVFELSPASLNNNSNAVGPEKGLFPAHQNKVIEAFTGASRQRDVTSSPAALSNRAHAQTALHLKSDHGPRQYPSHHKGHIERPPLPFSAVNHLDPRTVADLTGREQSEVDRAPDFEPAKRKQNQHSTVSRSPQIRISSVGPGAVSNLKMLSGLLDPRTAQELANGADPPQPRTAPTSPQRKKKKTQRARPSRPNLRVDAETLSGLLGSRTSRELTPMYGVNPVHSESSITKKKPPSQHQLLRSQGLSSTPKRAHISMNKLSQLLDPRTAQELASNGELVSSGRIATVDESSNGSVQSHFQHSKADTSAAQNGRATMSIASIRYLDERTAAELLAAENTVSPSPAVASAPNRGNTTRGAHPAPVRRPRLNLGGVVDPRTARELNASLRTTKRKK